MTPEVKEKLARTIAEEHIAVRKYAGVHAESESFERGTIHGLYRGVGIAFGYGAQSEVEIRVDEMLIEAGHEGVM